MEKYHYVDSSKIGTIEGRTAGDFLDVSIARNLKKIQADNNMAMLIENEGRDFYLIPRMEAEKKYNQEEKIEAMEKLKVVLMAGLFWTFIIWFARTMKRKSKEQYKKQEERMPEMESVTEEERCSYVRS